MLLTNTPCTLQWETFACNGPGLAGGGLTYNGYCDQVIEPPEACECDDALEGGSGSLEGYIPASKSFFGRGAIQLSWNYNFRAASESLTGDASTFCEDPDLVASEPEYGESNRVIFMLLETFVISSFSSAWGAGVFFWMETLKEETTVNLMFTMKRSS